MISNAIRQSKLLIVLLLIAFGSAAQKNTGNFHISGRIRVDNGEPTGSVVSLTNLTTKATENSTTVNSNGKFEFDLKYFSEYRLTVVKEGHYSKDIDISTVIPQKVWEADSIFPPFPMVVTIYKKVPDVTLSFEGKTVGKICYSPKGKLDNFDSDIFIDDKEIRREIDQAVKAHEDELFNKKMAEALDFEKNNQIREAIHAYEEALALRKNDQFIKPKLKELASDLKNLEKDALLDAEFNKLLATGDANVSNQKYPEAIDNFKAALAIKPGNQVASDKLTNAEQLLAKVNADKAKMEAEFNRLLAAGDANVAVQRYPEAIDNFKSALTIKTGDAVATAKLARAEQLLANRNEEKTKLEAEFNRLLAAGDENVNNQKYPEAITNFKGALAIKTGDKTASERLANAEYLLTKINADKAKLIAEYNSLVASGDANVSAQKYPDAIDNFKGALAIKAGDAVATKKLANAEQLLAKLNADKANLEAQYNRFLAAGDANVAGQKYPEAIENFKGALTIKTGDPVATSKLTNAEQLLAKLNSDKANQEAEFNRLLATGDANVTGQKYPEAIENFKGALTIKTGDPVATSKLTNAERLLAKLNADKAKQEAEFNRLLAVGDANVSAQKYPESIVNYKDALKIKPGEPNAVSKLANAERLLSLFIAEQKKEAEQRLLAEKLTDEQRKLQGEGSYLKSIQTGDANFAKSLWSVAIFYYQEALKFKAGDKIALEKIDNCKKMIDGNVTAEKMKEYNSYVKRADSDMQTKKYSSARFYYGKASEMLPWENYPIGQLKIIEKVISSAVATGIDAQYFDAIKKADDAVASKNYAVARFYFQKAISLKPDEEYPKQQLKRLSSNF